jgi:hypothetical protein
VNALLEIIGGNRTVRRPTGPCDPETKAPSAFSMRGTPLSTDSSLSVAVRLLSTSFLLAVFQRLVGSLPEGIPMENRCCDLSETDQNQDVEDQEHRMMYRIVEIEAGLRSL